MQALLLTLAVAAAQPAGNPPIEGNTRLLELVRGAQQTNPTLYERGRLHATVASGWSDDERRHNRFDAIVIWEGDKTYWHYSRRYSFPKKNVYGKTVWVDTDTSRRMIRTAKVLAGYNEAADLLTATPTGTTEGTPGYPDELELRPDRCWFHCWGILGKSRDWIEYLGPHPALTQENVSKYVVRRARDDRDRIIVEQHYKPGYIVRIEASLAAGGNVVAYSGSGRGSPLESEGHYEWAQHSSGVWYVKKHEFQRWRNREIDRVYSLEVNSYDPNPQVVPNQFAFTTLGVNAGTTVRELTGTKIAREYSFGSKPGESAQQQQSRLQSRLDELARRLGSQGFAAPEKQ